MSKRTTESPGDGKKKSKTEEDKQRKFIDVCLSLENTFTANANGQKFEIKTDNTKYLVSYFRFTLCGNGIYMCKFREYTVTFLCKYDFKRHMESLGFYYSRLPDEAYIISQPNHRPKLVIIEKKSQSTGGSADNAIWAGVGIKLDYQKMFGKEYDIYYIFVLNSFLYSNVISCKNKYIHIKDILEENEIRIFNGDDAEYFIYINNMLFRELTDRCRS